MTLKATAMRLPRTRTRRVLTYGAVAVCSLAVLAWLVVALGRAREEARSAQCAGNLCQLGLALHNYDSTYGCLPPACVVDSQGRPLYSWRVVLMAYLERQEGWNDRQLTERFRFDEPWDSPANRRLHDMRPPNFFCPSHAQCAEKGFTSFVVVVGPGTLFPPGGRTRRLADVLDDPGSTLMVVESVNSSIHWMEPRDLNWDTMSFSVNDRSLPGISSVHGVGAHRGRHAVAADGSMDYLPESMAPDTTKALLMIDDGKKVVFHKGPWLD